MILLNPVKKVNDLGLNVSADTYLEDDMGTYDIDDDRIYTNTKGVRDKVERKKKRRRSANQCCRDDVQDDEATICSRDRH